MFTASITYRFKDFHFVKGCEIWRREVLEIAEKQPGFVRMQFLVSKPEAMAIGTWKDVEYAEKFMKTGVFEQLMEQFNPLLSEIPVQKTWKLKYFSEKNT